MANLTPEITKKRIDNMKSQQVYALSFNDYYPFVSAMLFSLESFMYAGSSLNSLLLCF